MNARRLNSWRRVAGLFGRKSSEISFDGLDQCLDTDAEMHRGVRREFFQSHAPELQRSGRYSLFEFKVTGGDLNDSLVKFPIFAVILQPDFFQCFVAFKKKPVVELLKDRKSTRLNSSH